MGKPNDLELFALKQKFQGFWAVISGGGAMTYWVPPWESCGSANPPHWVFTARATVNSASETVSRRSVDSAVVSIARASWKDKHRRLWASMSYTLSSFWVQTFYSWGIVSRAKTASRVPLLLQEIAGIPTSQDAATAKATVKCCCPFWDPGEFKSLQLVCGWSTLRHSELFLNSTPCVFVGLKNACELQLVWSAWVLTFKQTANCKLQVCWPTPLRSRCRQPFSETMQARKYREFALSWRKTKARYFSQLCTNINKLRATDLFPGCPCRLITKDVSRLVTSKNLHNNNASQRCGLENCEGMN